MKAEKENKLDHSFEPSDDWRQSRYCPDFVWLQDTYKVMASPARKRIKRE